ncbi:MAG: hypothetical protein ACT4P7_06800 [Gemmatimonadaceae bacterium]
MNASRIAAVGWRRTVAWAVTLGGVGSACRSGPVVVTSTPTTATVPVGGASDGGRGASAAGWRIETREHVDLWLHGFAMLQSDSSLVPYYRLGYRAELSQARRSANAVTQLDGNSTVLSRRLTANPALVSAQFVALYFATWEDLRRGTQRFLRDNGNVRAADDQESLRMYATLATYFPSAADRDWLRLFVESLEDERSRFFRGWWQHEQAARASVRGALDALWRNRYAAGFGRFLHNTNQRQGSILLALPLSGEGRSLDVGRRDNFMTVGFPAATDDPRDALFVVAHEAVGTVSNAVVRDNTSPRDQQSGESGRLSTLGAVRGGAMLLQRVAPELVDGYRRYYLRIARQTPGADVVRQFDTVFALPEAIRTALEHQIDLVLNGI